MQQRLTDFINEPRLLLQLENFDDDDGNTELQSLSENSDH